MWDMMQAVITWKWHAYARRILLLELACFVLWLFSFNVFTIAFQASAAQHAREHLHKGLVV